MLSTLDRYLLRQVVSTGLLILGLGFLVVMLERLLAVLRLVSNVNNFVAYLGQMLVMLTPHYLGLILPAAFFLGILLTLSRMSRDSELAVMFALGAGLPRVLAPIMGLAVVLMVIATIILGYLTPHARYTYRSFKHVVKHATLSAGIKAGTFMHDGNLTFFLEDKMGDGSRMALSKVFVHEAGEDGGAVTTTANRGLLAQLPDDAGTALVLVDGERTETTAAGGRGKTTSFSELQWPIYASGAEGYGARGRDRRELTLSELWAGRGQPSTKPSNAEMDSELQLRLVIIASIPILPLLAAPLALAGGTRGRGHGIAIGLLILIAYHKLLASGDSAASRDMVSPWLGLWLPFAAFSLGSAFYCFRSAFRVPRQMWLQAVTARLDAALAGLVRAVTRGR